jgi:hypothetical protein
VDSVAAPSAWPARRAVAERNPLALRSALRPKSSPIPYKPETRHPATMQLSSDWLLDRCLELDAIDSTSAFFDLELAHDPLLGL